MSEQPHPRSFAHVGITVPDIEAALDWYTDVLGFEFLMGPMDVTRGEDHIGELLDDVLADYDYESARIAHTTTGNGVGVEFFEFDTTSENAEPEPTSSGPFHICVVDPDVQGLAERIAEAGGEQTSEVWHLFPDQEYRLVYCEDPYGNLIEVYSHSYEQIYSNQDE